MAERAGGSNFEGGSGTDGYGARRVWHCGTKAVRLSSCGADRERKHWQSRSMKPVTQLSAVELLELLRASKISPLELANEYIAHIERLNPQLNALVDFDADRVRAQVRETSASGDAGGRLSGLPVTVKCSISTAGHRCELGSLINRGHVPQQDAVVVQRLRSAGATILGTTNTPEFLMAYESDNLLHGRVNNPWNVEYTPGGSSGGESAAIAAGMSAGGLGSDSGGSVRVPAHFTGICSLKPTPGRIPGGGHLPPCVGPFSTLGVIGPMARTMEDVSLLFEVLSGQDGSEPGSAPLDLRKWGEYDLRRLPIGYFEDDGLTPVTPETRRAVEAAVLRATSPGLRGAGVSAEGAWSRRASCGGRSLCSAGRCFSRR